MSISMSLRPPNLSKFKRVETKLLCHYYILLKILGGLVVVVDDDVKCVSEKANFLMPLQVYNLSLSFPFLSPLSVNPCIQPSDPTNLTTEGDRGNNKQQANKATIKPSPITHQTSIT